MSDEVRVLPLTDAQIAGLKAELVKHRCRAPRDTVWGSHGQAVDTCIQDDDGSLWVDNGEYSNTVRFCPFCGFEGTWLGERAEMRRVYPWQ